MLKRAAAILFSITTAFAQDAVLQSDNSRRPISHWSAAGTASLRAQAAQGASREYHWAAFQGIVGPDLRQALAAQGIRLEGLAGRPGNLKLYKVRIPEGQEPAYEYLKRVTGFVNLLPIIREEKLSRGLLRAEGPAVKATVFFHELLSWKEMAAIVDGKVDEVFSDVDNRVLHVRATPERLRALADLEAVKHVQEELRKDLLNDVSREVTRVNALQTPVLNVTLHPPTPAWNSGIAHTGEGIWACINEGHDRYHPDFRESLGNGASAYRASHPWEWVGPNWHGSHVAGIVGGNGWNSEFQGGTRYQYRGVAPKVQFSAFGDKGDVNNHSFTNGDDAIYNFSDVLVDTRLSRHLSSEPDLNNVFVWSAANNGGYGAQYGFQRSYYSMLVNAKNAIKVGATESNGIRAAFSSMGPTRDGRWGPDVCAPGASILSISDLTPGYTWMGGTSMSGPHVTGVAALILHKYRDNILSSKDPAFNIHDHPMWNSTVKALLVHTATDLVTTTGLSWDVNADFEFAGSLNQPTVYGPGPDWATGFGMINAEKAVQFVDPARMREGEIGNGQTRSWDFVVPSGTPTLRATIAWDDPEWAGIPDQTNAYVKKLVNDLDLRLVSPTGQVFLPWSLNHAPLHNGTVPPDGLDPITLSDITNNPAVKARDGVNNVEVVDVANPAAGTWRVEVVGFGVSADQSLAAGLNQDFSLVNDFSLSATPPVSGPDLVVGDVQLTPSNPSVGVPVSFRAVVRNRGTQSTPAGTVGVEFRVQTDVEAFGQLTQALAPGQSAIVQGNIAGPQGDATWLPWEGGGRPAVIVRVDQTGAVAESDESNNVTSRHPIVPGLPEPWQMDDIGAPTLNGGNTNWSFSTGNFGQQAGGADIWGTADQFQYGYRALNGNGSMTVRVNDLSGPHEFTKAGIMIRENLGAGSKNAFMGVTYGGNVTFQHRQAEGGTTVSIKTPGLFAPIWLRLVRSGSTLTGFRSPDGVTWTQHATVTLAMTANVYIGFALTAHDVNGFALAGYTLQSVTGGVTAPLRGRILDGAGLPVPGATVTLSGGSTASTQTDNQGNYAFETLAAGGNYTATPSKTGVTFQPASASATNLQTTVVLDFSATVGGGGALPSPWINADVGSVGVPGTATHAGGTFTVRGSGADIWGTADGFHYAYHSLSGDGTITARVASVNNTNAWAKAGVMIRESITAGSKNVFMLISAASGASFQRRVAAGGTTASTVVAGIAAPHWVRLVRTGNNFKGYRSVDGVAWTLQGEVDVPMFNDVWVGLANTSHNNTVLGQGVFDNVTVQTAYTSDDVGAVGVPGSTEVNNGIYTVRGSGADIWGNADAFHFHHRVLNGDGEIKARVVSVQNTHVWAKAGIMIRETTAAGSAHAMMVVSAASGAAFQRRVTTGGSSSNTGVAGIAAPYWVRLVRAGNVFTASISPDNITWTTVGSATITMGATVRAGLALTSHNNTVLGAGVLESVSVTD